jgi:hypothetical protein
MATTAIVPEVLVMNARSTDLPDAGNGSDNGIVATTPSDGWVIAAGGANGDRLLLKFLADGSGDTATILAGDRPPSSRAGLGNLAIVLAASDVRYVCVEAARFLQNDGTIHVTAVDAGTSCAAFLLPKSLIGTSA